MDKLAVLAVLAIATVNADINITSPKITDWGVWHNFERCPFGRVAQGFQVNTEPYQGLFTDDTGMNGLRLYCGDPYNPDTAVITSGVGAWGSWGRTYSCYPGHITGFQLRVEPNQNSGDDTATNNIRIWCSANPNEYIEGDGMTYGSWSDERHCRSNQAVRGIQTQQEPDLGDGDDTAMNNLLFECVDWDKVQAA